MVDREIDGRSVFSFRRDDWRFASVRHREVILFLVRKPSNPLVAQLVPGKAFVLSIARQSTELAFTVGIGDAELLGDLLDFVRSPREALERRDGNSGELEIVAFPFDCEAECLQSICEPHSK